MMITDSNSYDKIIMITMIGKVFTLRKFMVYRTLILIVIAIQKIGN